MSERRRSSLLSLIRGKSSKDAKKESVGFERQVSVPSQLHQNVEEVITKPSPDKDSKPRKPVERKESSRLQSAAKLLRSLSKSKDVSKTSPTISASPAKPKKISQPPLPELPDRGHPAYLSEGKGARKRRNSGKENKDGKGKDRSHSFHGKVDKKERKYAALERVHSTDPKFGGFSTRIESPQNRSPPISKLGEQNGSQCTCEETVVRGAKSILLTEDNLIPIKNSEKICSPDLIQDLPVEVSDKCDRDAGDNEGEQQRKSTETDEDYVEADFLEIDRSDNNVLENISEDEKVITESVNFNREMTISEQILTKDTRLIQSNGYQDETNKNVGNEKKQSYVENYCNLPERPPSTDTDPTYATIEESKYQSSESLYKWKETYLDQSTTNGLYNGVSSSGADQTVPQEKSFIQSQSAWSQYSHGSEDEYTSHLRNSSYAMLKTPGENNIFQSMGPKSMLQANQEKFSGKNYHGIKNTSKFQSLPYIGSQVLSQVSGKSDDANELEEYAKKYEAIQRQSSRRTSASTTPIIDQLRRESQQTSFWSQAIHGSETDMSGRESVLTTSSSIPTNASPNGRESVTSAKSDSSGETLHGDMTQVCQSSGNNSNSSSPSYRSQQHEHLQNHEKAKPDNTRRPRSSQKLSYVPFPSASLKPMSNELTDPSLCTRMKPILYGSNDNRRKSDFYSLSDYKGFYKQQDLHGEEKPGHQPPAAASRENNLQSNSSMADESDFCPVANPLQPPSVNDRINQIEQFALATKQRSEDDYHLSKSVPNLVSENVISSQKESVESLDNDRYHAQPNYTYLDPEKKMKVTDNTLKLIQKQAVLEYYERQKKSSVDLTKEEKTTSPKIQYQDIIEDTKNADQQRRFLRSISQGSLTLSYPNSESEIMSHTNPIGKRSPSQSSLSSTRTSNSETPSTPQGTQHNGMLDPHKIDFQQDVSSNFNTKMIESCSKLDSGFPNLHGHHQTWKSKKENKPEILVEKNNSFTNGHYQHMSRLSSNLECARTPSPDLPPPPPEEEAEVLCNDEPLPPPPLRIDEENDKCNPLNEEKKLGNISKRNSPATIAAKGAPGWEKFLGGNTSNISFTSDEARKFRRTKDRHRARANDNGPKSLPYAFDKDGMKPLHAAKSSPSLNDKFQTIVGQNQWWKTSMDSLRSGNEYRPECYPSRGFQNRDSEQIKEAPVSHSHSNSDSGLSSLSGRTSCMSPMSVVSTGSSASSGSSRASLRSASIVSSTTIPLDEDDERDLSLTIGVKRNQSIFSKSYLEDESEINKMAAELFKVMPVDSNVSSLFGSLGSQGKTTAQYLKGVFNYELEQVNSPQCKMGYTAIHADQHSNDGINQTGNEDEKTGLEGQKIVDSKKCELEGHIKKRLSSLKIEEASMKEKEKRNADIGKVLMKKLQIEGRQNEVDKYKLHVEEVDKITSLILGLSSRLAKTENALINLQKNWNEDEELSLSKKKEKLAEQLEEAKALKASIDKRSTIVSNILLQYLSESEYNQYRVFIRTKVQLLIDSRLITERKAAAQQQLDAIMLQKGDL